jgi:hypothetical protein
VDSARNVIGCHLTQDTRVQNAFDGVVMTFHESLARGDVEQGARGDGHAGADHARVAGASTRPLLDSTSALFVGYVGCLH